MGRSRKKAAARKREARQPMPGLAPITGRSHPRDRRGTNRSEDARLTALSARCHHIGVASTLDNRKAATAPWLGSDLGRVLHAVCPADERARLWAVWQAWCIAERTYRARYLGQTGEPKGAAFVLLPEKLEADQGHTIDTRSADERDRDAVNGWMRWQGHLGSLPDGMQAQALHAARREDGPALWVGRAPTEAGRFTLEALRALAGVVERGRA